MNLMKFCFHWAMGCQTLGQISKKKWRTLIATWRVQIVMHYQLKTIKSVNQTGPKLTNNGGSIFLTLMARMVNRNAASPLLFLRVKAFNRTKKKKSSQTSQPFHSQHHIHSSKFKDIEGQKKKRRKILEEVQNTYCIKSINAKNKLPWIMPSSAKSLSIKSTPKNKLFHDGNIISEYNFVMQTPI